MIYSNVKDLIIAMGLLEKITKIDQVLRETGVYDVSNDGITFGLSHGDYTVLCTWDDACEINCWDIEARRYGAYIASKHEDSRTQIVGGVIQ